MSLSRKIGIAILVIITILLLVLVGIILFRLANAPTDDNPDLDNLCSIGQTKCEIDTSGRNTGRFCTCVQGSIGLTYSCTTLDVNACPVGATSSTSSAGSITSTTTSRTSTVSSLASSSASSLTSISTATSIPTTTSLNSGVISSVTTTTTTPVSVVASSATVTTSTGALPDTALISDNVDRTLLAITLLVLGLVMYRFRMIDEAFAFVEEQSVKIDNQITAIQTSRAAKQQAKLERKRMQSKPKAIKHPLSAQPTSKAK